MSPVETEALDALDAFVAACPQAGPGDDEFDVDRPALAEALHTARTLLYLRRGIA